MNVEQLIQENLVRLIISLDKLYSPELIGCYPSRQDELSCIAQYLCGSAMFDVAKRFMEGDRNYAEEFFNNVKYNSKESTPVIVEAIKLHYINRDS